MLRGKLLLQRMYSPHTCTRTFNPRTYRTLRPLTRPLCNFSLAGFPVARACRWGGSGSRLPGAGSPGRSASGAPRGGWARGKGPPGCCTSAESLLLRM